MNFEKILAAACVFAASVLLAAMLARENNWVRAQKHKNLRKEDDLWPARHAARWLCVATLLVTALQHWRYDYSWWPALTSVLKFLPDVLLVVFSVVYGASIFCPEWLAKYVVRGNAEKT